MRDPLFAPVCSITRTKRRRFFWAAWWTGPPTRVPFRKPDAGQGGARTREEALREAEKAAGQRLIAIDGGWARAWGNILAGEPPWGGRDPSRAPPHPPPGSAPSSAPPATRSDGPASASIWSTLGLAPGASVDDIKRAYRQRALETHPDRGGEPAAFRQVQAAYEAALKRRARPAPRRR